MSKHGKSNAGFTLIELLVVVIIVAVLAVVAVPLMTGNVERARFSEADAGLGTIRTALRAEQAENGSFPVLTDVAPVTADIGINAGDLNGRFFEDDDYLITSTATTYCVGVTGDTAGTAPRGNQVNGLTRSMNQLGNLFESDDCTGTAIN
jgi:prepilin-type N-terminal cleavage/methylation domain-containing protein